MKTKKNKSKLSLKKIQIAKIENPASIRGGMISTTTVITDLTRSYRITCAY